MTRETFKVAEGILTDIEILKHIKAEYDAGTVLFRGRKVSNEVLDDLRAFIDAEIANLEELLKKL